MCYHVVRSLAGIAFVASIFGFTWGLIELLSLVFRIDTGAVCLILMALLAGWLFGGMVLGDE